MVRRNSDGAVCPMSVADAAGCSVGISAEGSSTDVGMTTELTTR